jgi:hypothetical protein
MDTGSERPHDAPEAAILTAPEDIGTFGIPGASVHSAGNGSLPLPVVPEAAEEEVGDAEGVDGFQESSDANQEQPERHSTLEKVRQLNRFIDGAAKGLDPISAMVWITLFRFARGGIAWASQQTIAERLGLDVKTVRRHIKVLKKQNLLRVVEKGSRGGRCNTYQLGILELEPAPKRPSRSNRKPR